MKKITRMSLQELAKEMPVLSDAEQSAFIGGDRIIFDNSGHYLRTEVDDNTYDTIKIDGTNSGHILDASTTFSSYSYEDDNKNVATGFMFSGASIGLFEFFAQGTEVEWAYSYNEKEKGESNGMLHTTHQTNEIYGKFYSGFDSYVHSHPNNYTGYSPEDMQVKTGLMDERKGYSYKNFYVYAPDLENPND